VTPDRRRERPGRPRPRWYDVPVGCRSSSSFTSGPSGLTPGATVSKLRLEFGCARSFAHFTLKPDSPALTRYLGPEPLCHDRPSLGPGAIACPFLLPASAAYEIEYQADDPLREPVGARAAPRADAARATAGMSDRFPWQAWPKVRFLRLRAARPASRALARPASRLACNARATGASGTQAGGERGSVEDGKLTVVARQRDPLARE
jgi:hypothetical protein